MTECIKTTYETSAGGYGRLRYKGKKVLHHRLVYCLANGIDLAAIEGLQVLHSCDNPGCIAPEHLRLGTHAENMQDKALRGRVRGERAGNVKLTEKQVIEIRALASAVMYKQLAKDYEIAVSTVKDIVARKIWKHL